jgi:hypothetical protein
MSPTNLKPLEWSYDGACIICTSHKTDTDGYPCMRRHNIYRKIARWILLKRHGDLPSNVVSRHTCDNRSCINPDHIIAGTVAENNRDAFERKRHAFGERAWTAKLTPETVLLVRQLASEGVPQPILASRFGIAKGSISNLITGKTWKHL